LLGQSDRRPGCAVLHEMMLTARLPAWQELVEAGVRMAPFKISHVILNEQLYLIFNQHVEYVSYYTYVLYVGMEVLIIKRNA